MNILYLVFGVLWGLAGLFFLYLFRKPDIWGGWHGTLLIFFVFCSVMTLESLMLAAGLLPFTLKEYLVSIPIIFLVNIFGAAIASGA